LEDVDWINDAAKPMFLAVPPRRAAEAPEPAALSADCGVVDTGARDPAPRPHATVPASARIVRTPFAEPAACCRRTL
jgi:hypothetical protein